ncbi:MAG: DNA translocase FtsK [Lachnospiraceae bacterium]|nr:DNA translocase FtsK [Lachnospiraceae bacterium]
MAKKRPQKKSQTGSKQFESSLRKDILLIVVFALALFLFLCCFGVGGIVGGFISDVLFGILGLTAYIVPWLIFVGVLVVLSDQGTKMTVIKLICGTFFTISLSAFIWLFVPEFNDINDFLDYYNLSKNVKGFGGLFGGALDNLFYSLVGRVGTFVIVILIIVITVIIMVENSFLRRNREPGQSIFTGAKKRAEDARTEHNIRKEKRQLNRAENRLRKEEEWEVERHRRQDELVQRREQLAASRNNVTFDTKIVAPEDLPKDSGVPLSQASVPPVPEQAHETEVKAPSKKTGSDRVLSLEESIASQNVTEIIIPDSEKELMPDLPEPAPAPVPEPEPEPAPEVRVPEFRIIENTPKPEPEPEVVIEPAPEPEVIIEPEPEPEPKPEVIIEPEPVPESEPESEPEPEVNTEPEPVTEANEPEPEPEPRTMKTVEYRFPPIDLLKKGTAEGGDSENQQHETADLLVSTLQSFGVTVKLLDVSCGPTVTRYELEPDTGVKVSKIISLADDIKLKLAAADIRIEAPIPGKAAIGIEVPNKHNVSVMLRDLLEAKEFTESTSKLTFAVGKDIGGNVIVSDIAKMPHLLIAGATGSGKSVCLNTLIMSVLYKAKPEEVKLIMIDPKVVELSIYNGIPHLMIPVVTDPKKASGALNWAVAEMTNRYKSFADYNVRDIKGYNLKMEEMKGSPEYDEVLHAPLPQILIAVDELADLMMVAPREVEDSICRLAQLARAAGIHLVIATQRPSVDVITGLIKANMPSRLALAVSSGVDSRTVIDMNGAEKLLGNGDMLFYPQGYQKPLRVQGAYISDAEVGAVAEFLKSQAKGEDFDPGIEEQILSSVGAGAGNAGDKDELFVEAAQLIIENDKASIGMLQRKLRIGFNRAARIMDQLSDAGVVGPEEGTKPRTVLMSMEEFEKYIEESF